MLDDWWGASPSLVLPMERDLVAEETRLPASAKTNSDVRANFDHLLPGLEQGLPLSIGMGASLFPMHELIVPAVVEQLHDFI